MSITNKEQFNAAADNLHEKCFAFMGCMNRKDTESAEWHAEFKRSLGEMFAGIVPFINENADKKD